MRPAVPCMHGGTTQVGELPGPRRSGPVSAASRAQARDAEEEGRAEELRPRRHPVLAGPARRAVLRAARGPRRLRRAQAQQGDVDRRGRRRHVPRRHRHLHRRAHAGGVRGGRGLRDDLLRSPVPAGDAGRLARARRDRPHLHARAAGVARGGGARRAQADRRARLAARLRRARPAGAQPAAGALLRRGHRPAGDDVSRVARHPARGDAHPRQRHRHPAQPVRRAGGARPRAARGDRRAALRRRGARRRAGGARRRGLRRLRGPADVRGRGLGARRAGGHQLAHRELPRLPHRHLRQRPHARRDAAGAPLRRGLLQLPPRGRAGGRP